MNNINMNNNLCVFCTLRASNEGSPNKYISALSHIPAPSEIECTSCLGILQHHSIYSKSMIEALSTHPMIKTAIETKDKVQYTLRLSLPCTILIREEALRVYVASTYLFPNEEYPSREEEEKLISNYKKDHKVLPLKDIAKLIYQTIIERIYTVLEAVSTSYFHIDVGITRYEKDLEATFLSYCGVLPSKQPIRDRKKHHRYKRVKIQQVYQKESTLSHSQALNLLEKSMTCTEDYKQINLFPLSAGETTDPCIFTTSICHDPVYVSGKYCKYDRELSQSPWIIDGKLLSDTSVEEEISRVILPYFGEKGVISCRFHSSGREDRDVRMLGNGRQFVLELLHVSKFPKNQNVYNKMQEEINHLSINRININSFHLSNQSAFNLMNKTIADKKKTYRAVVWTEKAITKEDLDLLKVMKTPIVLKQITPIRVLHRRNLQTRERSVYNIDTEFINSHFFVLDLLTQSGTYIKEFVHGDRGRTQPNIGQLLNTQAQILQLDVLSLVD